MSEVWGTEEHRYEIDTNSTCAMVNGSTLNLTPGADFKVTLKNLAADAGFGKFRVFLNGNEISPSESPSVVNEGDKIELRPYDVAGA